MKLWTPSGQTMLVAITMCGSLIAAGPCWAADIPEAGGGSTGTAQVIDAAQDGPGAFTHTITDGIGGDSVLIGVGVITTVANHGTPTPAQQQVAHQATPNGSIVITTGDAGFGYPDMNVEQYDDNTYTNQIDGHDNDRGAANSEETPYDAPLTAGPGPGDNVFLEFHEVAGVDHDPSITFGYELYDITNATHRTDFFRLDNLVGGSTVDVEVLTDQATFGFFDSRLTFYDGSGAQISTHDGDAGVGVHELVTGIVVPGDGSLIIEVNNSKSTNGIIGAYDMTISGTAIPEPSTLALLGLASIGLALRGRRG